jgi:hypothetical protein
VHKPPPSKTEVSSPHPLRSSHVVYNQASYK